MYSISEVVLRVGDRILCIVVIPRLPSRARHPNDPLEPFLADNVYYRLEIITKGHRAVLDSFTVIYVNRFVGKFDTNLTCIIIEESGDCSDCSPYGLEIFLVVIANLYIMRTNSWRTYDYIHSMCQGFLNKRGIECFPIHAKPSLGKLADVLFSAISYQRQVGVVGPTRIKMKAEDGAIGSLVVIGQGCKQFLKIIEAGLHILSVILRFPPLPAPSVEIAVGGVHDSMKRHGVSLLVNKVLTFDRY